MAKNNEEAPKTFGFEGDEDNNTPLIQPNEALTAINKDGEQDEKDISDDDADEKSDAIEWDDDDDMDEELDDDDDEETDD